MIITDKKIRIYLYRLLYKKRILLLYSIIVMLLGTFLSLGFLWALKIIVDVAIPQRKMDVFFLGMVILIVLPILSTFLISVATMINTTIGGFVTDDLRKTMFNKIITLSPGVINKFKTGDLVGRLTRSCGEIGEVFIKDELLPALSSLFMFVGIIGFMCFLNWQLAMISLIMVPLIIIASKFLGRKSEEKTKQLFMILSKADAYFTELITGIKTVQMYTQEIYEQNYMEEWIHKHRKIRNQTNMIRVWCMDILNRFEQSFGIGIIFTVGAWKVMNDELTIGALIAFTIYIPQLYNAVEKIQRAYVGMSRVKPALQQIQEVLDVSDKIIDLPNACATKRVKGIVEFKNISFCYSKNRGKVNNINFSIYPNETVGIVGPTGGGKSTLLDLLMRFYDPDNGEICIDGKNLDKYRLSDIRKNISFVSQDIFLWNKSIRENFEYAKPDATFEEMEQATKKAQIDQFICQLPSGYDTVVGSRGLSLSGGERQRLVIAQAILRDTQIVLLDEPTSALDARTENLLQNQLEKFFVGKTVMIVAHRLSTLQNVDKIMVVVDGEILEMGTHLELMQNKKIYYELYSKQEL